MVKTTKPLLMGYGPAQTTTEDHSEVHLYLSKLQNEVKHLPWGHNLGRYQKAQELRYRILY